MKYMRRKLDLLHVRHMVTRGGVVFLKLLVCGARGPRLEPYDFKDWVCPASESLKLKKLDMCL